MERPDIESFACDIDGLSFVVDNSVTAIIYNVRKLFTGKLTPTKIMLETAQGMSVSTQLEGAIRLVLTDNTTKLHTYKIPGCIFDLDSPINIVGYRHCATFSMIV